MPTYYIGKTSAFFGKTLFDILCNLKNFGVGRMIVQNANRKFPEPCFYSIRKIEPYMDEKLLYGNCWVEEVFRGHNVGAFEDISKQVYKTDFELVPKGNEWKYLEGVENETKPVVLQRDMAFSPALHEILLRGRRAKDKKTSTKISIPNICKLFPSEFLLETLFSHVQTKLKGPIPLPAVRSFIQLYDGQAYGLENMEVIGTPKPSFTDDKVTVSLNLRYQQPFTGRYRWYKPLLNIGGNVHVTVSYLRFQMGITMSFSGERPKVTMINVQEMDGIKVRLTGFGVLSPVVSHITTFVARIFRNQLEEAIENLMLDFIDKTVMGTLLS